MTKLETFLKVNIIRPMDLHVYSLVSRQHINRLRRGEMEPTRRIMVLLAKGCTRILRRTVAVDELFDLE
jgi:hypothetical protein